MTRSRSEWQKNAPRWDCLFDHVDPPGYLWTVERDRWEILELLFFPILMSNYLPKWQSKWWPPLTGRLWSGSFSVNKTMLKWNKTFLRATAALSSCFLDETDVTINSFCFMISLWFMNWKTKLDEIECTSLWSSDERGSENEVQRLVGRLVQTPGHFCDERNDLVESVSNNKAKADGPNRRIDWLLFWYGWTSNTPFLYRKLMLEKSMAMQQQYRNSQGYIYCSRDTLHPIQFRWFRIVSLSWTKRRSQKQWCWFDV